MISHKKTLEAEASRVTASLVAGAPHPIETVKQSMVGHDRHRRESTQLSRSADCRCYSEADVEMTAGTGGERDSGHSIASTHGTSGQMQQPCRRPSHPSKGDTNLAAPPLTARSPGQVGSIRLHINLDIAARMHCCLFRRSGLSILSTRRGGASTCRGGRLGAEAEEARHEQAAPAMKAGKARGSARTLLGQEETITQGLLSRGVDAQPFGEVRLDRAVALLHFVEGSL